jgi:hypothetical protein
MQNKKIILKNISGICILVIFKIFLNYSLELVIMWKENVFVENRYFSFSSFFVMNSIKERGKEKNKLYYLNLEAL